MEFSRFLEERYRRLFHFLDILNAGSLTEATFETIGNNLWRSHGADENDLAGFQEKVLQWWIPLEAISEDGQVGGDRFLAVMKFVCTDPEQFHRFQKNCQMGFNCLFDMVDRNNDGQLSPNEFVASYRLFGITDENFAIKVFWKFDVNSIGAVFRDVFLDILNKYFFSNDPNTGCDFMFNRP